MNDDGWIDIYDAVTLAEASGTSGMPLSKAALVYDSGWLDLTGLTGKGIDIIHNLGLDTSNLLVDARQRIPSWNQTYGRGSNEWSWPWSLVQTNDQGYALAGVAASYSDYNYDFWLLRTDAGGNAEWNKTYGGANEERAYDLTQTVDGGYVMAGSTSSYGAGSSDAWLLKTDQFGNMVLNRTYGGTGVDEAWSVIQTLEGGYVLAGSTDSYGAGGRDFWLVKTDTSGNAEWNGTYGGTENEWAFDVVQTLSGGYAIVGDTFSFGAGSRDCWFVKTDANGKMQSNKTYGGTGNDDAKSMILTSDGDYALGCTTTSFGTGNGDSWLIKTGDESGLAWHLTDNTITLYKCETDPHWNYVRVRILKRKQAP